MWARLENVFRLGVKELLGVRHDWVLVLLIIYGFTYSIYAPSRNAPGELVNASAAVVDEDHSAASRRLRDALRKPFVLPPGELLVSEIDPATDTGRFTFVIDIPPKFEADLRRGRSTTLQLIVDATAMSQATSGVRYIQNVVVQELTALSRGYESAAGAEVKLVTRQKFNPNLEMSWFTGVVQIINQITLLTMFLTGAAVIREREHGTLEHLLVLPLRPVEIMLAKVWANGLVVLAAATLSLLLVVRWWLGVPIPGSVPLFIAGQAVYLFSITSLGIFLATLTRSMPQFALLALATYIVMNLLSGGVTPLDSMPEPLQAVMQFSPATHFVSLSQAILFREAGLAIVWGDFAAVAAIGAVLFAAALARFRKTLIEAQS